VDRKFGTIAQVQQNGSTGNQNSGQPEPQ